METSHIERPMTGCIRLIRPQRRPYPREGGEDLCISVRWVRDRSTRYRHPQMYYDKQYCDSIWCHITS
jgi:hypothetical protein